MSLNIEYFSFMPITLRNKQMSFQLVNYLAAARKQFFKSIMAQVSFEKGMKIRQ